MTLDDSALLEMIEMLRTADGGELMRRLLGGCFKLWSMRRRPATSAWACTSGPTTAHDPPQRHPVTRVDSSGVPKQRTRC